MYQLEYVFHDGLTKILFNKVYSEPGTVLQIVGVYKDLKRINE